MTSPALPQLSYEAWIVRRTSANALHVLHAAVADGPGEVLVPLPWPEVRLLDEAPDRVPFSQLWPVSVSMWQERYRHLHGIPKPPPKVADDAGERGARLLSREALPEALAESLPPSWSLAQKFLLWPAAPERRGIATWFSRGRGRPLAPVALAVEGASSPFRERVASFELSITSTAELVDSYVIDPEQLEVLPQGTCYLYHRTGLALPGLLEPSDHLHWRRDKHQSGPAYLARFQLYADALRNYMA